MRGQVVCEQVVLEGVGEADDRTREADGGIQNQKQEPHIKMWGKT